LERIVNKSLLAIDDMKVKLLSPDIAVVHARMTLSTEAPVSPVAQPGPRATIASFVLHRTGDRWQVASAHHTDVVPNTPTNVINETGGFGGANYPSDQAS
jgi:hypothetical protein